MFEETNELKYIDENVQPSIEKCKHEWYVDLKDPQFLICSICCERKRRF
jgi:hypothetical protein